MLRFLLLGAVIAACIQCVRMVIRWQMQDVNQQLEHYRQMLHQQDAALQACLAKKCNAIGDEDETAAEPRRVATTTTTTLQLVHFSLWLSSVYDPVECPAGLIHRGEYVQRGFTINGSPFYMAAGDGRGAQYMYHDPDCSGSGHSPRWIVGSRVPASSRRHDLDADGECRSGAFVEDDNAAAPPESAEWVVDCGRRGPRSQTVTVQSTPTVRTSTTAPLQACHMGGADGVCLLSN